MNYNIPYSRFYSISGLLSYYDVLSLLVTLTEDFLNSSPMQSVSFLERAQLSSSTSVGGKTITH